MISGNLKEFKLYDYIKYDNNCYYISTVGIYDDHEEYGYSTAIFKADDENKVLDWNELYKAEYQSSEEAKKGHEYCKNNIGECLKKY